MQTLNEFFRSVYVPLFLSGKDRKTFTEYRATVALAVEILDDPTIKEINLYGPDFVRVLQGRGYAPATVAKHCRHLNAVFKKIGPKGPKNHDATGKLKFAPYFQAPNQRRQPPRVFSDREFQSLYTAFGSQTVLPGHLPAKLRPAFWRTVMHFVSVTALRREAVLGIEWCNVNTKELFLQLPEEIDKKNRARFKPITPDLLEKMLELQAHGRSTGPMRNRVFPWQHGNKAWYQCWNEAEKQAGVKLGLHDLKRFAGELALRAGATVLELQQHMDHANIKTTLEHYVRPQTRDLVGRIQVPIPKIGYDDPLDGMGFAERSQAASRCVDEMLLQRLVDAGVDFDKLAGLFRGDRRDVWETSTGTRLRLFDGEEGGAA